MINSPGPTLRISCEPPEGVTESLQPQGSCPFHPKLPLGFSLFTPIILQSQKSICSRGISSSPHTDVLGGDGGSTAGISVHSSFPQGDSDSDSSSTWGSLAAPSPLNQPNGNIPAASSVQEDLTPKQTHSPGNTFFYYYYLSEGK